MLFLSSWDSWELVFGIDVFLRKVYHLTLPVPSWATVQKTFETFCRECILKTILNHSCCKVIHWKFSLACSWLTVAVGCFTTISCTLLFDCKLCSHKNGYSSHTDKTADTILWSQFSMLWTHLLNQSLPLANLDSFHLVRCNLQI